MSGWRDCLKRIRLSTTMPLELIAETSGFRN